MGTRAAFYKKSRGVGAKGGENHPAVLQGRGGNLPPQSHVLKPALGGWLAPPRVARGRGACWEPLQAKFPGEGENSRWTPSTPGHQGTNVPGVGGPVPFDGGSSGRA